MRDPYVYEGTNILVNKANIRNQSKLDEFENGIVSLALTNLLINPFVVDSVMDIMLIHKLLFSEVYDFAGQIRVINICKSEPVIGGLSIDYSHHLQIEKELREISVSMESENWESISGKELTKKIAYYLATIWKIHPFREGNTRCCTIFMLLFLKKRHIKINEDFLAEHAKFFRNSLVLYSVKEASEPEYLLAILDDAISLKVINEEGKTKYRTIKDYKIDNYKYGYHHIKK